MKYLNLGCGGRYHVDWVNVDFTARSKSVIVHDLSKGIPAADNTYDVVYHSHLLEHFSKDDAPAFIKECYRVLSPGGTLRVVVPDLEAIAKAYLNALDNVLSDIPGSADNYHWMLLELLDQTVRNHSGGAMAAYLQASTLPNRDFISQRFGRTAQEIISAGEQQRKLIASENLESGSRLKRLAKHLYQIFRHPSYRREKLLQVFLGSEYDILQLGRFRQSGEIHQWMYDRYSLKYLLERCRFSNVVQRSSVDSYIENWFQFNLDTEPDGSIYKPDSLYMEAIKP